MTTKVLKDRWELRQAINNYLDKFEMEDMHDAWEKISKDPWLFDANTTVEEAMILKLKDKCPSCGYSARYHKDDCEYSINQLMFRELESADKGMIFFMTSIGELLDKKSKLGDK